MDIKKLQLENIGRFKQLDIDFAPTGQVKSKVTIFIADNGGGKTTILKSLATVLSWLVNRINKKNSSGTHILPKDITNGMPSALISVSVQKREKFFKWSIAKSQESTVRKQKKDTHESDLKQCTELADLLRYAPNMSDLEDGNGTGYGNGSGLPASEKSDYNNLPLILYCSEERVWIDVPSRIRNKNTFNEIDGYDNALTWGVDFRRFFEWFREREDIENEQFKKTDKCESDLLLNAVRSAIQKFITNFGNLQIQRYPRLRMTVEKAGEELDILQLSQGEKSLMALVGDIARRLAIMNPNLKNPLEGDGVILIDEVDMHLHPKWQRSIVENLVNTFPNCQFILTTHSPIVISDYKDILLYSIDADGDIRVENAQYGKDVNMVLLDTMDAEIRNKDVTDTINNLRVCIYDNKLQEAKKILSRLEKDLTVSHIDIQTAKILLKTQELKNAKNKQG